MNELPTHIDLFSGICGFALAAEWAGFKTVAFCEIDTYCRKVLAKNFEIVHEADFANKTLRSVGRVGSGNIQQRQEITEGDGMGRRKGKTLNAFGAVVDDPKSGGVRNDGANKWSPIRKEHTSGSSSILFHNIFDFDGTKYRGCDLLTGGFPCQPFSVAGKRGGAADDRAIWPQMFRVIREAKPAWILAENVPGIIPMELDNVLSNLESIGYACWPLVIPACAVDAKHRRDRVWIIGRNVSDTGCISEGRPNRPHETESWRAFGETSGCSSIPNSDRQGLEGQREIARGTRTQLNDASDYCRWEPEPDVGRVAHGVRNRVDRLKGLGNAIVPQVAYEILLEIRKLI